MTTSDPSDRGTRHLENTVLEGLPRSPGSPGRIEDPQADPGYVRSLAPPMSDGFYRTIGEYAAAENAKAEGFPGHYYDGPDPDAEPVPYTLTPQAEALLAAAEPEPETEAEP